MRDGGEQRDLSHCRSRRVDATGCVAGRVVEGTQRYRREWELAKLLIIPVLVPTGTR